MEYLSLHYVKNISYKLYFSDCRWFMLDSKERIKEHKKSLLGNNIHSSYSHQLRNWRHHFDFDFGILHSENKSLLLTLLGCVESGRFHFEGALSNVQLDVNRSSFLNLFPWRRWDFRQCLSVNCNFY